MVKQKRRIIWYNPPYNEAVETNIGKQFLKLISKHFPKNNPIHSILNRNTVKLLYSCTKNIKATIQSNKKESNATHNDNICKQNLWLHQEQKATMSPQRWMHPNRCDLPRRNRETQEVHRMCRQKIRFPHLLLKIVNNTKNKLNSEGHLPIV